MKTPDKAQMEQVITVIHDLNDIYFDIVKRIYSADFAGAKKEFLQSESMLTRVIEFSFCHDTDLKGTANLDLNTINQLVMQVLACFDNNNPQVIADLLLFDFSSVLNDYADELEKLGL